MSPTSPYIVRAVACDYQAPDEDVYEALKRAVDPLTDVWERLRKAKRIGLKINQDKPRDRWVFYDGQLQQLVSSKVLRAVLRLLRERTDAELVCTDVSYYAMYEKTDPLHTGTAIPLLREYGVTFVDATKPPYRVVETPGGGQMFGRYLMPASVLDVDEFISVAKLKNHAFMGVTLTLKNLFGLMPGEPEGHTHLFPPPRAHALHAGRYGPHRQSHTEHRRRADRPSRTRVGQRRPTKARRRSPTRFSPATTSSPRTPAPHTSWVTTRAATGSRLPSTATATPCWSRRGRLRHGEPGRDRLPERVQALSVSSTLR